MPCGFAGLKTGRYIGFADGGYIWWGWGQLRRLVLSLMIAALAFLTAGSAVAGDTPPLVLKGRVSNEDGLPVVDAQVKVERAGALTLFAVTDDAGLFSFKSLAAGEYLVTIQKAGYFLLSKQKVELSGESQEFSFVLNHEEEVREKVDVTATPNTIDPTATQSTESLSSDEIRDIPVASTHDLTQSLVALPEVVKDNSNLLHIAGSRNTTESYYIDGFGVGDPASNGLSARMIVEAVRTSEIQTGRFGAEYPHPGAAILSYETREGDDRWRFNAVDFIPGINVQDGVQLGNYYPRVVISGPIVKDTLWFMQSFDLIHTLDYQSGLPPNVDHFARTWSGDSWSKLLWKQSTNSSLHISFLANVDSTQNAGLTALNPPETTTDNTGHRLFAAVKEQSYIHKTLVEFGAGIERAYADATPMGTQPYIILLNGTAGNYFDKSENKGRRYQTFADAIGAPVHWMGAHTFSGGANLEDVELVSYNQRGEIQALLANNQSVARLTTFTGDPQYTLSNTLAGGFVQDSWAMGSRVTTQVGVRADWDRLFQAATVQPHVAVNVLPFSDGRAKLSVGWGRYNIPLNLSVIGQAYDQQEVDTLFNYDKNYNLISTQGPATSAFILPPGGLHSLQQPYFDITSVGYEQKIGKNTLVKLELLARKERHGLVYETLLPGQIGSDFMLQSTRQDSYRGVTVSARHTFANTADLFVAYTRSSARSDQVLDPVLGSLLFAPQQPGPLLWDAPNRFLSWASVPTPIWGILFSYLFEYRTGYPWSAVNQQQFLVGAANSFRFPAYANLTIGLEKKFTFRDRVFAARLAMINILGRQNPNVVVNNVDAINPPVFGSFEGGQGRAFTARLRLVGRK